MQDVLPRKGAGTLKEGTTAKAFRLQCSKAIMNPFSQGPCPLSLWPTVWFPLCGSAAIDVTHSSGIQESRVS